MFTLACPLGSARFVPSGAAAAFGSLVLSGIGRRGRVAGA
jgi:hypothetical protein